MVRCANFVALVPIPLSETVRQVACVSDDDGRAAQSVQKKDACPSSVGGHRVKGIFILLLLAAQESSADSVGGVTARQQHTAIGIN